MTDEAGILGQNAPVLEQRLAAYEQSTGHQLAVLIVPSLRGEPIETFSLGVAEQWRLGSPGRDDGVLMVVAMEERAIRLEVGYGLEGALPDAVAARIIRDQMAPRFRAGDPAGGVAAGVDAVMQAAQVEGRGIPPPSAGPNAGARRLPAAMWVLPSMLALAFLGAARPVRTVVFFVLGGFAGAALLGSGWLGIALAMLGALLGLVLPRPRRSGGVRPGPWWLRPMMGPRRGGSQMPGGFRGGGGRFGGGGASGRW